MLSLAEFKPSAGRIFFKAAGRKFAA